ncbi:hypothetical protein V7266_27360 [Neobacillus drentensis]|uniref:hypothetical protein n=1 Tax=Neobacillus drentensis TaxID=220684 RepID=UPI002FFE58E8
MTSLGYKERRDDARDLIRRTENPLNRARESVTERRNTLESIVPPQTDPIYIANVAAKEALERIISAARTNLEVVRRTAGRLGLKL